MPFTFALPDPDSSVLQRVVGPDGIATVAPTPELQAMVEATLDHQQALIGEAMAPISSAVGQQLHAQAVALGAANARVNKAIQRQIDGQSAAIGEALQAVADHVTGALAQQSEAIGTVAISAALRPAQPAPMPDTNPYTSPAPRPPLPPAPPRPPSERRAGSGDALAMPHVIIDSNLPCLMGASWDAAYAQALQEVASRKRSVVIPAKCDAQIGGGGIIGGGTLIPGGGWWYAVIPSGDPCTPPLYDFGPEPVPAGLPANAVLVADFGSAADRDAALAAEKAAWQPDPSCVGVGGGGGGGGDGGGGGFCPPPPFCPPPDFCPPPPVCAPCPAPPPKPTCTWIVGDTIPPIGGPEWCRLQGAITDALAGLGSAIIDLVLSPWGSTAATVVVDNPGVVTTVISGFSALGEYILDSSKDLKGTLSSLIECWKKLPELSGPCAPKTMLGLVVFRAVVRMLRNMRVGTDAGVWATVDIAAELPQMDRVATYIIEAVCPSVIPSATEAWSAYAADAITEDAWRCWTLADGCDPDLWKPVREAQGHALSGEQVILWCRLTNADPKTQDFALYSRGWTREIDRQTMEWMYDRIPDGKQYLRWQDVGALDEVVTSLVRRDEGFDSWWNGVPGIRARAHGMLEDVARYDYRAQQPLPGLHELREALYRPDDLTAANLAPVTEETVRQVLEAGDMTPLAVDWAMATIYRVATIGDVMSGVRAGLFLPDRIYPAYLEAGYSKEVGRILADAAQKEALRGYHAGIGGWTLPLIVSAARAKMLLPPSAGPAMQEQGYTDAAVSEAIQASAAAEIAAAARGARVRALRASSRAAVQAYSVGVIDAGTAAGALIAAGYSPESAAATLTAADLALTSSRTSKAISLVGKAVRTGELTTVQAGIILATAGVTGERINQWVNLWDVERAAERPMAHVGEIRKWVSMGLLSLGAAQQRLANLGWRDPDLTLQVQAMAQQLNAASALAKKKGAAAALAAANAASKVRQQAIRALAKTQPLAAIAAWYKDGLMTQSEVSSRLLSYGYDQASIDLYIRGWDHQRAQQTGSVTGSGTAAPLAPQKQVPLATVKRWYKAGIVDQAWVTGRLTSYGYDAATIGAYLSEWAG